MFQGHERGFPSIVEELYHLKRIALSYAEVPVILTSRGIADQRGSSFIYKPSVLLRYLLFSIKAAFVTRPTARHAGLETSRRNHS